MYKPYVCWRRNVFLRALDDLCPVLFLPFTFPFNTTDAPPDMLVPINCQFLFMISTVPISYLIYAPALHPSVTPTLALERGHIQDRPWWSIIARRLS